MLEHKDSFHQNDMSRSSSLLNENFKPPSQNLLGPQGLLGASRQRSDDAAEVFTLLF